MPPCGNDLLHLLQTGGVQEMEEREGGPGVYNHPAAAAAADTSVLVPGRGGGGDGDGDVNDVVVLSWIPDLGSNGGGRSGGRPPRGLDWGWGLSPVLVGP